MCCRDAQGWRHCGDGGPLRLSQDSKVGLLSGWAAGMAWSPVAVATALAQGASLPPGKVKSVWIPSCRVLPQQAT